MRSLRYFIVDHRRIDGVTLSKAGEWGNIHYPDDATASAAARKDAGGAPLSIERSKK